MPEEPTQPRDLSAPYVPSFPAAFLQRRVSIDDHVGPLFGLDRASRGSKVSRARPPDQHIDGLGRIAEAHQHSRIVGRRVARIGARTAPELRGSPIAPLRS